MASKSKASRQRQPQKFKNDKFYLIAIPLFAFIIKLITMANISNGGWLGADGESYLSGVDGLLAQGYFSDKGTLSYWLAGYPILIWLIAKISLAHIIWILSLLQSAFYAYASYYFVKQLRETKLRPYIFLTGFVLAFNPTLSLSSLAVGYESPVAACMLMAIGTIIKPSKSLQSWKVVNSIIIVGFFCALASFMQPRWILTSIVIAIAWALRYQNRKIQAVILVGVISVMAVAPAILIQRNFHAMDRAIISTNLGVTMQIGAGDETSGGYKHTGPNILCETLAPVTPNSDSELVKCVINWYLTHPIKATQLFINKSLYFWSPWSGPLGNGTMARNPWLKIDPVENIAKSSRQGNDLVNQGFGKAISFLWLIGGISLVFIGFFWLRSMRGVQGNLAYLALTPVVISWLVSMGTIGDHRFRIPTMPLSLFLQVMGYFALRHKAKTRSFAITLESNAKSR